MVLRLMVLRLMALRLMVIPLTLDYAIALLDFPGH